MNGPTQGAVIPFATGYQNISLINKAYNGANLTLSLSAYDLENQIVVMTAGGNTVGSGTATQVGYQEHLVTFFTLLGLDTLSVFQDLSTPVVE
jgi:hypothetical protein